MAHPRGEPLRCPACNARLVEMDRADVMIDACPQCRGVWLDRGELDRLLDRERRAMTGVVDEDEDFFREMGGGRRQAPAAPRLPAEHRYERDERSEKKRKRRSLLEDLFDFD